MTKDWKCRTVKLIINRSKIQIRWMIANYAYKSAVAFISISFFKKCQIALHSNSYRRFRLGYINYAQYSIAGFTFLLHSREKIAQIVWNCMTYLKLLTKVCVIFRIVTQHSLSYHLGLLSPLGMISDKALSQVMPAVCSSVFDNLDCEPYLHLK